MSILDSDHIHDNVMTRIKDTEDRLDEIERNAKTGAMTMLTVDVTNISNPPTDAELDAIFGDPDDVGAGYVVLINDAGAGANEYLVWSDGSSWWYATGTKAI